MLRPRPPQPPNQKSLSTPIQCVKIIYTERMKYYRIQTQTSGHLVHNKIMLNLNQINDEAYTSQQLK